MKSLQVCFVFSILTFGSLKALPVTTENDDLRETIKILQRQIYALERDNREVRTKLDKLMKTDEKRITADTVFLATIGNQSISVETTETIVWDSAPINPGGHFDTTTGGYTALFNGYYQFSASKRGLLYGSFFFLVDGERYAVYDIEEEEVVGEATQGSATINIQLTAGQVVQIRNILSTKNYGTELSGYVSSWFTGHLLYAL